MKVTKHFALWQSKIVFFLYSVSSLPFASEQEDPSLKLMKKISYIYELSAVKIKIYMDKQLNIHLLILCNISYFINLKILLSPTILMSGNSEWQEVTYTNVNY